jgi:hypothetical protein
MGGYRPRAFRLEHGWREHELFDPVLGRSAAGSLLTHGSLVAESAGSADLALTRSTRAHIRGSPP